MLADDEVSSSPSCRYALSGCADVASCMSHVKKTVGAMRPTAEPLMRDINSPSQILLCLCNNKCVFVQQLFFCMPLGLAV